MRVTPASCLLAVGTFLCLSACSTPQHNTSATASNQASPARQAHSGQPPRNQCQAQAAQFLVGQPFDGHTLARALSAAGADEARALDENSAITKEMKPGRLNVVTDAAGRVVRVYCG